MEALSSETELKLFYKLFADDLVVFLKHSQINRFLTKFGIHRKMPKNNLRDHS